MNRGPIAPGRIGLIAGHALPSFGDNKGLDPVNAVTPPLEAKNAYARAPHIAVRFPLATNVLTKPSCADVRFVKVLAIGLRPGITGIVAEEVIPCETLLVKNPDSFRRRCSNAKKKKVRTLSNGPPSVNPNCVRVKGGSSLGAKALRAWKLRCRD